MEFCTALTIIFANSCITTQGMANYIGYDSSYISKWKSGKSSPSQKASDAVIQKMCAYIFSECSERDIVRIFNGLHERPPEGIENRKFFLEKFLEGCLLKQASSSSTKEGLAVTKLDAAIFPMGKFNGKSLYDYLFSLNKEPCDSKTVVMALDPNIFNDFFFNIWNDLIFDNGAGKNSVLYVLWVNKGKRFDLEFFKMLIRLMSHNNYDQFYLLEASRHRLHNILLSKHQYLLAANPDLDSDLGSMVVSSDDLLIDRTYSSLLSYCRMNYNSVTQVSQCTYISLRSDIEMSLYGRQRQLLSIMYPLYMDRDILALFDAEFQLSKEWISFQNESSKCQKTVLLYRSALIDYVHNGVMVLDYKIVTVPPALRIQHLNQLLTKMQESNELRLIILDDKNPVIPKGRRPVAFLCNFNQLYVIERAAIKEYSKVFFLDSKDIITCFLNTYDSLLSDCSVFKKYCIEDKEAIAYIQALIDAIKD